MSRLTHCGVVLVALGICHAGPSVVSADVLTFSNSAPITVPETGSSGPASPYPSEIDVSGIDGEVLKVTVTVDGINSSCSPDLDVLVQGPSLQDVLLMSDNAHCFMDASDVTLTFDDAAADYLPEAGTTALVSGTFRPSNSNPSDDSGDFFAAPGPTAPYGTALSAFNGLDPNGTWKLFVMDDTFGDTGNISRGWSLNIEVVPEPSTITLLLTGALGFLIYRIRRR